MCKPEVSLRAENPGTEAISGSLGLIYFFVIALVWRFFSAINAHWKSICPPEVSFSLSAICRDLASFFPDSYNLGMRKI